MNKQSRDNKKIANGEKKEISTQKQRLHFILLRVLLFVACVAVSVALWLTVQYAEYLHEQGSELPADASAFYDATEFREIL